MIRYKIANQKNITKDTLKDFQRYQETHTVLYNDCGTLKEKEDHFIESWDKSKLEEVSLYLKDVNGIVIFAIENNRVIGFTNIDFDMFGNYVNLPYIHVSNDYRNRGVGQNLMLLISKYSLQFGAQKLYISAHPALETQYFYKNMGCVLAKEVNENLLALEPLDLQLERPLKYYDILVRKIALEFKQQEKLSSVVINKLINKIYQFTPDNEDDFVDVCLELLKSNDRYYFSVGTLLFKKCKNVLTISNLTKFEKTLLNDIKGWGQVDQYCYRVLSTIIYMDDSLYKYVDKWSLSEDKNVRRAALVSMLHSSGKITCTYDYDKAIRICERLKHDEDFHVRKAVGWVLKCLYPTYPNQLINYLKENVNNLDRMIFRYALEHIEPSVKSELMNL